MKRIFLYLILMVGALTAKATTVVKVASPVKVMANGSVILPVEMDNDEDDISLFEIYFRLPAGFALSDIVADETRCPSDFVPAINDLGGGVYQMTGYSSGSNLIAGNSGTIFTLVLTEDGTNAAGTYTATINDEKDDSGLYPSMVVRMPSNTAIKQTVQDFTIEVTDRLILDENATVDPVAATGVNVTVNRTIKANEWSTIVLPFTMSKTKAEAAFGADVQLAEFAGFVAEYASDEDVSPDAITVNFTTYTMTARKGMTGGKPFIIKTTKDITSFNVDEVTINNEITSTDKEDENGTKGKYTGSFKKAVVPVDGLFLNDNKFWYSTGKTNIKAFRGWLELGAVLGKDTDFGVKLNIIVDGEETKIDGINSENTNDAVYTLDGKYVGKDMNRLRKGIYIQNGKKVVK